MASSTMDLSIPSSPASEPDTIPPSTPSADTSPSPTLVDPPTDFLVEQDFEDTEKKKKKKKKPKKKKTAQGKDAEKEEERPQVLCISRNKHWRYISSYHGPWLQLPLELLESLLVLNLDPSTLSAPDPSSFPTPPTPNGTSNNNTPRLPPPTPNRLHTHTHLQDLPPPFPPPKPGKPTPPPIDPGVFRSVTQIRRLIDEASELSVRASSGLSSSDLSSLSPTLSHFPNNGGGGNGRSTSMSPGRIHRLRVLAVQKLAQAYKLDEIASSVMVMQGGSVFDDLAERVLKVAPDDANAKYVHFFHEKIPSRQLAESTSTAVLDDLITKYPQHLEYFRTRGIVHCFRDEYVLATKDFTHAIKEARAERRHRVMVSDRERERHDAPTRRKRKGGGKTNGQAPPDGTAALNDEDDPLQLHPSVLPDAPDPIEPQLYFLRGAAHLQHAIHLIESALSTFTYPPATLLAEARAYRFSLLAVRDQVNTLLKKSLRDHEKFLSHFDSLESPGSIPEGDISFQISYAFLLSESGRPGHSNYPPTSRPPSSAPATFTTYHPLLVESHYSILLCYLLMADFRTLLEQFKHCAGVVDGLEGYPVFLPPRSMAQAEFVEVLERLASGWAEGAKPHSLSSSGGGARGKARLAIEPPPPSPLCAPPLSASSSMSTDEPCCSSSSSSSSSASRPYRADAADALDCARILLAPVVKRQSERSDGTSPTTPNGSAVVGAAQKLKPAPINIPLHGPRVEVILAWLGGVHLPEVEGCI